MTLTPCQRDVATFVRDYRRQYGYAPTLNEIAEGMGTSKVTVFEHVAAMERKGVIRRTKHAARSIELLDESGLPPRQRLVFPVLGVIGQTNGKGLER